MKRLFTSQCFFPSAVGLSERMMMMSVNIFCAWEECETASEGICDEVVSDASWGVGNGDAFS